MDTQQGHEKRLFREKSPGLATFLGMFPGCGVCYAGNIMKGLSYMLIFAALIVLIVNQGEKESEVIFAAIALSGFYIFQIVDSYNEAVKYNIRAGYRKEPVTPEIPREEVSLFMAIVVLVIGILFQLANLGIMTYSQIGKMWPLILIIAGIKAVLDYYRKEGHHEPQ
jgi:hypothetical protein